MTEVYTLYAGVALTAGLTWAVCEIRRRLAANRALAAQAFQLARPEDCPFCGCRIIDCYMTFPVIPRAVCTECGACGPAADPMPTLAGSARSAAWKWNSAARRRAG